MKRERVIPLVVQRDLAVSLRAALERKILASPGTLRRLPHGGYRQRLERHGLSGSKDRCRAWYDNRDLIAALGYA